MEIVTLKIKGMTCGGCGRSVARVLNEIAGVANAQVEWENGRAVVQFDATQTHVPVLIEAVEDAGFDAIAL